MSVSSMKMRPELGVSRPAIMRSVVDFPQPDGPTSTVKDPSSISRFRSGMITSFP